MGESLHHSVIEVNHLLNDLWKTQPSITRGESVIEQILSLSFVLYFSTSCSSSDVSVVRDWVDYCNLHRTRLCHRAVHHLNRWTHWSKQLSTTGHWHGACLAWRAKHWYYYCCYCLDWFVSVEYELKERKERLGMEMRTDIRRTFRWVDGDGWLGNNAVIPSTNFIQDVIDECGELFRTVSS